MLEQLGNGTTVGQIVLLLATIVGSAASIWKSGQAARHVLATQEQTARHQLEMLKLQHQIDVEDRREKAQLDREARAALANKVETEAQAVRQRLDIAEQTTRVEAETVRGRLDASAERTRDLVTATVSQNQERHQTLSNSQLDQQTLALKVAIADAQTQMGIKADAAFHEANTVNMKLEKLHTAHAAQAKVLETLLSQLTTMPANAAAVAAAAAAAAVHAPTMQQPRPRRHTDGMPQTFGPTGQYPVTSGAPLTITPTEHTA